MTLDKSIYLFGGIYSPSSDSYVDEVVKCIDSSEGYRLSVAKCENGARKAGTACAIGKNRAVLFGGSEKNAQGDVYPTDLWLFADDGVSQFSWQKLDTDGENPPGRAFHSAVICGDQGRYMVVVGGQDAKGILGDMWLLDLSSMLGIETETSSKGRSKKQGTRWSRMDFKDGPCLRCMHSSFAYSNLEKSTGSCYANMVCIFGGVGKQGVVNSDVHAISLACDGSDDPKFLGSRVLAKSFGETDTIQSAAATVASYVNDDGVSVPAFLLVFGGSSLAASSKILPLDDTCDLSQSVMGSVKALYPDPVPDTAPEIKTHLQYPNGDVYDGDLTQDSLSRHGRGRMTYADGTIYEVHILIILLQYFYVFFIFSYG